MLFHRFLIFVLLYMNANLLFSQQEETVLGSRGYKLSGIWGGSNHQMARFGATNSYLNGGFFGFEFGKALLVGVSSYELEEHIRWDQFTRQPFKMRYRGILLGYGFSNHKAIHPEIKLDFAPGRVEARNGANELTRDRIFVIQPAIGLEINVFRWFHLGLSGGYRFVTDTSLPSLSDKDLSGAFGQLTAKFGWSWGPLCRR